MSVENLDLSSANESSENISSLSEQKNVQEHLSLEELWDQLNFTDQQKQDEQIRLENLMKQEKVNVINSVYQRRDALRKEIQEIKQNHIRVLTALGKSNEEKEKVNDHGNEGTLIQRLEDVKAFYDEIEPLFIVRVKLFQDMFNKITELYDTIGYGQNDRGEFVEFQTSDLTAQKENVFLQQIKELEEELKERKEYIEDLHTKIKNILEELGEEVSPAINDIIQSKQVTTTAHETILEYYEGLTSTKEYRAKKISELALEITHCWDLLRTPDAERKSFIDSHSKLSLDNIKSLEQEIERLHSLIEENLSEMLVDIKKEISEICTSMHYTQEQIDQQLVELGDEKETFYFLAKSLIELKKLHAATLHVIQMIQQREDIVKEYESIDQSKISPTQLDKIKRKYKCTLPRVEKKLLMMLIEYNEFYSRPFTWDGEIYADKLSSIKLSLSEIRQAKSRALKKLNKQK
ncbi:hypothetical protein TRFO_32728 [Tritrichomonas foetus]|uniref:Uncharacterized protein n=1 Tax=Tritrichomonas foetus TaxID=1144522 RepID=A0A1J4JNA8_9EUKA|nr:hypothetical protein TRFO_32728 [Tritrichomonas foetus]|eukprot:OHT00609.1 hypothetical protein TRFO_32728 [Tritrichomonas foetus]